MAIVHLTTEKKVQLRKESVGLAIRAGICYDPKDLIKCSDEIYNFITTDVSSLELGTSQKEVPEA